MSTPGISELPLAILLVPDFHAMVRRCRYNAIAIEVELGDRHQVPMAGVEIGESRHLGPSLCHQPKTKPGKQPQPPQ